MDFPSLYQAIAFATKIHSLDQQQLRKGTQIPYITHPLGVALIVAKFTQDDQIISAAVLHDTIEDCKPYGSVTKAIIAQQFGEKVARIVDDLTEQDKTLPWEERKMAAIAHIPHMQQDSLLVKSADTLYNLTELIEDITTHGQPVFKLFNAPRDKIISNYALRVKELEKVWPGNPILPELKKGINMLVRLGK